MGIMSMIGALRPLSASELEELRTDPSGTGRFLGDGRETSLGKMWQAVHYLLAGTSDLAEPPLGIAVYGGAEVGPDLGYGPARVLAPAQVAAVADALEDLTDEDLRRRFVPADLERDGVYPPVWDEPEDRLFDEIMECLADLRACYREAAAAGDGMLQFVT
jgi:hypothetical protein